jgi:2-oxoglutarate dehydrogenase E1 component
VIVDQFICSAEDKWNRLSGITMLLPHGFEGAGPEHCSGRLERFLTSSAAHNMQITVPSTAAQYFHLLRRQVKRLWRKPLIVFTPKSLLREPMVMSELEELSRGTFRRVLSDLQVTPADRPKRVLIAAGKVAIDLLKRRSDQQRNDVAIIRLEQLYPFPYREIAAELTSYADFNPDLKEVYWVQEEPRNMGAGFFIRIRWEDFGLVDRWKMHVVSRPESASPSTGSKKAHYLEQEELLQAALGTATVRVPSPTA